jgi:beta-N-acetylhexosaminidase
LHGLLREELGFDGLVITDALDMRAVSATVGMEEAAVRSLAAGADALCLGAGVGPEPVASVHRALVEAVRAGRLPEERLREAARRVGACHVTGTVTGTEMAGTLGGHRQVGLVAARRALRVEGVVALSRPPLVVELAPEPSIAAGGARHGLGDLLAAETVRLTEPPAEAAELGHGDRQVVLVVRDAHRHAWERDVVEGLVASARDAVVVETGLPRWRPSDASGYVATHGAGRANLEAAAERLVPRC